MHPHGASAYEKHVTARPSNLQPENVPERYGLQERGQALEAVHVLQGGHTLLQDGGEADGLIAEQVVLAVQGSSAAAQGAAQACCASGVAVEVRQAILVSRLVDRWRKVQQVHVQAACGAGKS